MYKKIDRAQKCSFFGPQNLGSRGLRPLGPLDLLVLNLHKMSNHNSHQQLSMLITKPNSYLVRLHLMSLNGGPCSVLYSNPSPAIWHTVLTKKIS